MIRIVGDICFSDGYFDTSFGVGTSLENGADPFVKIERSIEDFWIGNFECVCSDISNKKGVCSKQFRILPDTIRSLHHFDLYCVANNHIMQHGESAYRDTLENIKSFNVNYVGSDDQKCFSFVHKEKKISVISFSQRNDNFSDNPLYWYNPEYKSIEDVLKSTKDSDFRIGYLHWGNEFIEKPYEDQKKFAHYLIDIGFDIIVGCHPHILQGYEIYKNKHIFYSIGNFVFNMQYPPLRYGAIVNIDILNNSLIVGYQYIYIDDDYFPISISELEVPEKLRFSYLNELISRKESNEEYYEELYRKMAKYRKSNKREILSNLFKLNLSDAFSIILDYIKRRLL